MKRLKKLNRTQRKILSKLGYSDLGNIWYLTERGDSVVFVHIMEDSNTKEEILVSKKFYYENL